MAACGIAERAVGSMIDPIPNGEIQVVLAFHLKRIVQGKKNLIRIAKIDARQGIRAERIDRCR